MNDEKTTSPWVWFGCGCASVIGLLVLAFGGIVYFGYSTVKSIERSITDPEARAGKVGELLQTEAYPPGYEPVFGLSVPFVMDMAVLSTEPVEREDGEDGEVEGEEKEQEAGFEEIDGGERFEQAFGDLGRGALFYLRIRGFIWQDKGVDDWDEFLQSNNIEIDERQQLSSGEVRLEEMDLVYSAYRGRLHGRSVVLEGVYSVMLVSCADSRDNHGRLAIWFEADEGDVPVLEPQELIGTPADPDRMAGFMGYLHPCGH